MSRLIDELKRKFPTPQDAVTALGLDPALLDDDAFIAMDGASDALRQRLSGMSRDERRRAYDLLREHEAGLAAKYDEAADRHRRYPEGDRRREREVADRFPRRRRRAEDDPPDFPDHPHPGGSMTAPAAFDSAHDRGFFDRFPETKHITVLGR